MAQHDKDMDLLPIQLPTAPEISDNDFLLMKDVDSGTLLSKKQVRDYRTFFGTGYPRTEDLPDGDIQPPDWMLEGIDGAWRVTVTSVVPDAICYIVYWFDAYLTGQWIPARTGGIWEYRQNASEGVLELIIKAPAEDPPRKVFRIFKIRSVSGSEKGPLSEKKEAHTKIWLPADFIPTAPSLDDEDGYPYISYAPMPNGAYGYTITVRIVAATGQRTYIKQYKLQRATDSGVGSFDGTEPYFNLPSHPVTSEIPPGKIVYHNTDDSFEPGWKYRYRVIAVALNGIESEPSAYQDITLTDDTTAPDAPTFVVTTFATHFEVKFEPPTQNEGDPCNDLKYWIICYKPEGQTGDPDEECEGCGAGFLFAGMTGQNQYTQGIPVEWADKTLVFRAKAEDHSGNQSAWSSASDPDKIKKVTGDIVDSRTIDAGHVVLKALTNAEIADLTIQTEQLANLSITETKVGNLAISTPKLQALSVEAAKIAAGAISTGKLAALAVTADKIAANAVTLSKINFIPLTSAGQTGEIIATINASTEGGGTLNIAANKISVIAGAGLHITGDTTIDGDTIIQGILKVGGGLKSASGTGKRFQLGNYLAQPSLAFYDASNNLIGQILGGPTYTYFQTLDSNYEGLLSVQQCRVGVRGGNSIMMYASTTSRYLSVDGNGVVGAQGAAIANPTDAATTMARLIDVLDFLRGWGAIAAA